MQCEQRSRPIAAGNIDLRVADGSARHDGAAQADVRHIAQKISLIPIRAMTQVECRDLRVAGSGLSAGEPQIGLDREIRQHSGLKRWGSHAHGDALWFGYPRRLVHGVLGGRREQQE